MGSVTVYIDMDGVLADFVSGYLDLIRAPLRHADITAWDIWRFTGETEDLMFKNLEAAGPTFWEDLRVYPEAMDLLYRFNRFRSMRYYPRILTAVDYARNPSAAVGKSNWAPSLCMGLPLVFADSSQPGGGAAAKARLAQPGDILIDDSPANVKAWIEAGGRGYLYPRPWNRPWNTDAARDLPGYGDLREI